MTNIAETIDLVLLEIVDVPPVYKTSFSNMSEHKYPQESMRSPKIRRTFTPFYGNDEEMELQEMNQSYSRPIGPSLPSGPRSYKLSPKKSIQYKVAEYFYEIEGHVDLINRLLDTENPLEVSNLTSINQMCILVGLHCNRNDIDDFSKEFKNAYDIYIQKNLPKSIKEFTYAHFDSMYCTCQKSMNLPESVKKQTSNYFCLEAAHKCLNSDYLSIRVHGCKFIEVI